jgi:hypothetical protein
MHTYIREKNESPLVMPATAVLTPDGGVALTGYVFSFYAFCLLIVGLLMIVFLWLVLRR